MGLIQNAHHTFKIFFCDIMTKKKTTKKKHLTIMNLVCFVLQGSGCGVTRGLCWTRGSPCRTRFWVCLAAWTVLFTTPLWVTWCSSRAPVTSCLTLKLFARSPIIPAGWQTGPACRRAPTGRWPVQTADFTCSKINGSGGSTLWRCGSPERASGSRI